MGRNYYCEYCDKRMKDDVQIRKKHIGGVQHQAARSEHYAQLKGIYNIQICRLFCNDYIYILPIMIYIN